MNTLYSIAALVTLVGDATPDKEDIKAGWGAFGIFIAMAIAVGFLGWSLTRHLRKAQSNAEAGAFGDVPEVTPEDDAEA